MADYIPVGLRYDGRGATQFMNDLTRVGQQANRAGQQSGALSGQMNRLGGAFNNARFGIQNTAFQLQDIIVQMEMGVPITRTLGQQLPQLLGGFGPLGAVIGVAAGAMLSLLPLMFDFTEEAEDSEEAAESFADALDLVTASVESQIEKFDNLSAAYERAQTDIESLSQAQLTARATILEAGLSDTAADLSTAVKEGGIGGQSAAFERAAGNLTAIAARQNAEAFIAAFDRAVQDQSLDPSRFPEVFTAVEETRRQLGQLDALLDAIKNLNDIAGPDGKTITDIDDRFRTPLLRSGTLGLPGREGFGVVGDESTAVANARIEERIKREIDLEERVQKAKLDAAGRSLNARLQLEKEAEREMERAADTIAASFERAFLSIIDGTKDAKAAFSDMARSIISDIARIVIQQQVSKPIAGFLSSALKGFFGGAAGTQDATVGYYAQANGGAWRNGVQMFANGGIVNGPTLFPMANGAGLMGEAGPEAIMPLKRGSDGKLGVAGGGGGQTINVNIINENGGDVETQQNGGNIDVYIRKVVAQDIKGGGAAYQAISKTFNIQPGLTRRQ
jgi:molecular chaperone GrpE (heat shock protein)